MPAIETLILPFLNRLLTQENWARERLLPFTGHSVGIDGGPFRLAFSIDESALFSMASPDTPPDVTISFGADAPFRLLADPGSVFTSARLSGTANFAETLAFVFRNLRWHRIVAVDLRRARERESKSFAGYADARDRDI